MCILTPVCFNVPAKAKGGLELGIPWQVLVDGMILSRVDGQHDIFPSSLILFPPFSSLHVQTLIFEIDISSV